MSDVAVAAFKAACQTGDTRGCSFRQASRQGLIRQAAMRSMAEGDIGRGRRCLLVPTELDAARLLCERGWSSSCWWLFAESEKHATVGAWLSGPGYPRIRTVVAETPLEIVSSEPTLEAVAYRGARLLVMHEQNDKAQVVLLTLGRVRPASPLASIESEDQLAPPPVAQIPLERLSDEVLPLDVPARTGVTAHDVYRELSAYPLGPPLGSTLCGQLRIVDTAAPIGRRVQQIAQTIDGVEIKGWVSRPIRHVWEDYACRQPLPRWDCERDGYCTPIDWAQQPLPKNLQRFKVDTSEASQALLESGEEYYLIQLTDDRVGTRCVKHMVVRTKLVSDTYQVASEAGPASVESWRELWQVDINRLVPPVQIPLTTSPWGDVIGQPLDEGQGFGRAAPGPRLGFVIAKVTRDAVVVADDAVPLNDTSYADLIYRPADAITLYRRRVVCEMARAKRPRPLVRDVRAQRPH
ncbi:MAG: hypothetical protein JW940_38145 [Polyangiaceae bacterium]|nr:hypothetical protein [Polyangiaceae bacterium]